MTFSAGGCGIPDYPVHSTAWPAGRTHRVQLARDSVSEQLRVDFVAAGYPLATDGLALPAMIQVYPHPALLTLMQADCRLPCKGGPLCSHAPR